MAKIRLLSPSEYKAFQLPPVFLPDEKVVYFELTDAVKKILDTIRAPYRKIGFLLQFGYFRRVGKFFSPSLFHKQDIAFVAKLLALDHSMVTFEKYKEHSYLQDQQKIMELLGFQSFNDCAGAKTMLLQEVERLATSVNG